MSYLDILSKYPYAKQYIQNIVVDSCEDFPLAKYNKKLNDLTEDTIRDINEIVKWKKEAEEGKRAILKRPQFKLSYYGIDYKREPIRILNLSLIAIGILIILLICLYIWGPLSFYFDYQYIIFFIFLTVICISIRFYHVSDLIKSNLFFRKVVPYAFKEICERDFIMDDYELLTSFDQFDFLSSWFIKKTNFGYLLKVNAFYWATFQLLEKQVNACPEKIYKYYRQSLSDPDKKGVSYSISRTTSNYYLRHRQEVKKFISISCIYDNILRDEKSYRFLMNIITPEILESKVWGNEMQVTDENLKKFIKENLGLDRISAKPKARLYSKIPPIFHFYKTSVIGLLTLFAFYYPFQFRYDYIEDRLKENLYHTLLTNPQKNAKTIHQIESVVLDVEVSNEQIYNNHVGHEWSTKNSFKGIVLKKWGNKIRYHYDDPISLYTEITEHDTYDDCSSRNDTYNFSKKQLIEGVELEIESYVHENRGRYSGCDSKWISTYKIKVKNPNKPIYDGAEIESSEVLSHLFDDL